MKIIKIYENPNQHIFSEEYTSFRIRSRKFSKKMLIVERIKEMNATHDFKIEYTTIKGAYMVESIIFTDDKKYLEFILKS